MKAPKNLGTTKTVTLCGETYERIPCGEGLDEMDAPPDGSMDCTVSRGEIHEIGCDFELCPRCGDQCAFCEWHSQNQAWLQAQAATHLPKSPPKPDPNQSAFNF